MEDGTPAEMADVTEQHSRSLTSPRAPALPETTHRNVLLKLYTSHALSAWNSRTFEFGAVLFLATIFPGTLFYASCYALVRSVAATLLSSRVGTYVDRADRLTSIRASIVWQRIPVATSCGLLLVLYAYGTTGWVTAACFPVLGLLACLEKLAAVGNVIAVERDWIVVIAEARKLEKQDLNAGMRRIDLCCKLVAPVLISLVDSYSTAVAIWCVLGLNCLCVVVEYVAIAQVYQAVPQLQQKRAVTVTREYELQDPNIPSRQSGLSASNFFKGLASHFQPWREYFASPVSLPSLSLCLLYLTVLSTGVQFQTYMLAIGYSSIDVSLLRLAAVVSELSATCINPVLTRKVGAVRSGLWSINWQLIWLTGALVAFMLLRSTKLAAAGLTVGIIMSRLGLWGFDLAVQYIIQENAPESSRGRFSAIEMALQNLFETLSFASTVILARPEQFRYPVFISYGALIASASCYASYVRQERGHLLHASRCFKREAKKYYLIPQLELQDIESGSGENHIPDRSG